MCSKKARFLEFTMYSLKKLVGIKIGREENKRSFNSMKSRGDQEGVLKGQMRK